MQRKLLAFVVVMVLAAGTVRAQFVRMRLSFPVGITVGVPGPAPFTGGIWIGPEWMWRGGRYVYVPGYWRRPPRFGARWIPGHWKMSRRGWRWVPGHWA